MVERPRHDQSLLLPVSSQVSEKVGDHGERPVGAVIVAQTRRSSLAGVLGLPFLPGLQAAGARALRPQGDLTTAEGLASCRLPTMR
jgi:hypothetical protein